MFKTSMCALALATLAACGGDAGPDDKAYRQAVAQAQDKQAEATALAVTSPCSEDAHCANLQFYDPAAHCADPSYKPYSLTSPTAAAASAAAADERAKAAYAISIQPATYACTQAIVAPPKVGCVVNTCQTVAPTP